MEDREAAVAGCERGINGYSKRLAARCVIGRFTRRSASATKLHRSLAVTRIQPALIRSSQSFRIAEAEMDVSEDQNHFGGAYWTPGSLAHEIGLLRTLTTHLERRSLPFRSVTQDFLRKEGLGHVREVAGGIIAIRMPGHHAFTELTDCVLDRFPIIERGAMYADIQTELFRLIGDYIGQDKSTLGMEDASALLVSFKKWFDDKAIPQRVFVPCVISAPGDRQGVSGASPLR